VTTQHFPFARDPRFGWLPGLLGTSSGVTVDDEVLDVRFGPWHLRTPLSNITGASVTGPYMAVKALGPRLSLSDRGVTFGTTTRAGACVLFAQPVPALDPLGLLRHPGATLTVADPARLVAALGF
jgi:hypothetical protein